MCSAYHTTQIIFIITILLLLTNKLQCLHLNSQAFKIVIIEITIDLANKNITVLQKGHEIIVINKSGWAWSCTRDNQGPCQRFLSG